MEHPIGVTCLLTPINRREVFPLERLFMLLLTLQTAPINYRNLPNKCTLCIIFSKNHRPEESRSTLFSITVKEKRVDVIR